MSELFANVKPGQRVHYMTPQGQTKSGTVVMNRKTHLVLNRGKGQPQVVTADNYVKHSEGGRVKGALLSRVAKSMKEAKEASDYSPPFEPDAPTKNDGVVKGKRPVGMSIARHLARMARDKAEREKNAVKEEDESLAAYKTALAYKKKKDHKKKKKQVLHPGRHAKGSVTEAKSEVTGREMAEYIPDGQGKYKVNYIHPDKSKKENDRF